MALRFTNVQTAPVGHNGPPKPARDAKRTAEEQAEREQVYRFAILQFVENRRLEETLGQGELASLESGPRFFTLMKGILPEHGASCSGAGRDLTPNWVFSSSSIFALTTTMGCADCQPSASLKS